ncbi:MAG: CoA transferase [Chloroflexi bacterium]|nr:CoA transferase [Chloroflexota bacterium]
MADEAPRGPLAGLRVLDLATERAELAGRLLADLGADVLKVEPPGGAAARRIGPFDGGVSLYWSAVALNKRSVSLDYTTAAGRAGILSLADTADVLIESFEPGELERAGLGYAALRQRNPALVYVSVTPFGQDGPEAGSPAAELTVEAAGGLISMQGDGDRPPVPVGYPQSWFHAGAQAAADAVIALNERAASGRGQHLDVSAQAAVVWTLMNATGYPPNTGADAPGYCEQRALPSPALIPGLAPKSLLACKDGYLVVSLVLGAMGYHTTKMLLRWAEEEDQLPPGLRGLDFGRWPLDIMEGKLAVETTQAALAAIEAFMATRTKYECQQRAVRDALLLAPMYDCADVAADPQLTARGYWQEVGGRRHPGAFAKLSRTPIVLASPAPSVADSAPAWARPALPAFALPDPARPRNLAFDGLRVADFAWVGVGPITSKALADHGAIVVHVETSTHTDTLRNVPPFKDGVPGLDRAQFMANYNSSKLGITLDFTTEKGLELARKLIDWADVVVESFTPGTMAKFGLDYATISKDRPDLIMLSTCLRGQTGPEATYAGYGGQGAALAGLHYITGWPDRPPAGTWGAYTDFVAPRYAVTALASAILERRRSGLGQYIDVSQVEAAIHFIEPLLLDYEASGHVAGRPGTSSPSLCPHGVYPAAGTERYLAIVAETEAQWAALLDAAAPALAPFAGPGFASVAGRLADRDAIDAAIAAWTAPHDAFELSATLRAAGVPANTVMWPSDLYRDPQLTHRGFFVTLNHTVMGPTPYDGLVTRYSETPGRLSKAAPCLGEDNDYVLREILGLSDDEVIECVAAGALT